MFKFAQNESTASRRRIFFYAVSPSDGFTMVTTGLSTSTAVSITKNGVTPVSVPLSPSFTHISNGLWYYEFPALSGYLDTVGVLTVTIVDALIRTVQLIGYVYAGDPLASSSITAADVWTYGTRDLTGSVAVASIANNAITAASIADGAIDAATFADSALVIGSGAAGGVKAYLGAGSITAGVVATGAIDADAIASDAITAAKIATGAIDADALATDAVTEIVNGVWSRDPSDALFNGFAGYWLYQAGLNSQQIVSDTAAITSTPYIESIADALLNRNIAGGSDGGRTVKDALRVLRNKTSITASTLTVYQEDDGATLPAAWTATLSTSATADPVTGIDPV
jgi:hypothetical protein